MIRILWADDQINVIRTLSNIITPLKHTIDISDNCKEALEKIINNYYDLLILDLMMPPGQWGGLWLLDELNRANISIPVLILSGEGTQTETIKALRLGANDYVTKEKVETELLDRINAILESVQNSKPSIELIKEGESERIEFKSTLRWNINSNKVDKLIEQTVLKTISAFLNSNGGTLIIGVNDNGCPIGLKYDKFKNNDKMNQHLINLVKSQISVKHCNHLKTKFEIIDNNEIFRIDVEKAKSPAFFKHGNEEYFYIRTGPASTNLPVSEVHDYIKKRFKL